ncbi:LacI family gluconate utilization system Gnt-I transcriptional repressor [Sphingomonas vulcanisoli]|uniref:LacI family gluconate utilization system Gnt-I transcriptional repressor n=1 Tax=Sphingomonas vulcanisoli TaxID=1658060 RepID=A0ABX0TUY5_9SPHN|nr:LacI family DNA-binding transcriptional regulator [Sphingomonas vulcanisoli]NIJ07585.1 LacI family gluconate utilization system Gnt-I transcriptional repressor [Sphingomonas vulcanisoli]
MAAKLQDVAQLAGVSPATVSRYLNKQNVVAIETGKRIRAAIEELGYIPNLMAGGLASSKSRLIAVQIPFLSNSIFEVTIEAMVAELEAADMNVILGLTGPGDERSDRFMRAALSRKVDAIIITGEVGRETQALLRSSNTTVLQIWDTPPDPIDLVVGINHYRIGEEIARFLARRGYQRPHIAVATGARSAMRRDGFAAAWKMLSSIPVTETLIEIPSHFAHARRIFAEIRRLPQPPDAIVCGSDLLATGLLVEAQTAGVRVPDEIAIVGFGNSTIASEMRPTITSIDIDGALLAREAIRMIRQRVAGETIANPQIDIGFRLIARESA